MNEKDKELLAQFHHTVSEQLNARLSESPKFFGLLIIVSTGYGYVLANPQLCQQKELLSLATWLALAVTVWASWYLAALGYAFRFLQNIQHQIEHALQWSPNYTPASGEPPQFLWNPLNWFWLLPGIYHPHVAGLSVLLLLICLKGLAGSERIAVSIIGLLAIAIGNLCYLKKFRRKIGKAL
ncbi:MAG: hypothetical protein WA188_09215 [Terriglobales bacterium]